MSSVLHETRRTRLPIQNSQLRVITSIRLEVHGEVNVHLSVDSSEHRWRGIEELMGADTGEEFRCGFEPVKELVGRAEQ